MSDGPNYGPNDGYFPRSGEKETMSCGRSGFRKELEALINKHSIENGSDTPDFILADYIEGCLGVFDRTMVRRDAWHGFVTLMNEKGEVPE